MRTTEPTTESIREWFDRHRGDYCVHDLQAPPKVWSEYFDWLLRRVESMEGQPKEAENAVIQALQKAGWVLRKEPK